MAQFAMSAPTGDGPSAWEVPIFVRPFVLVTKEAVRVDPRFDKIESRFLAKDIVRPLRLEKEQADRLTRSVTKLFASLRSGNNKGYREALSAIGKTTGEAGPSGAPVARVAPPPVPPKPKSGKPVGSGSASSSSKPVIPPKPKSEKPVGPGDSTPSTKPSPPPVTEGEASGSSSAHPQVEGPDPVPDCWEALDDEPLPTLERATYHGTHPDHPAMVTYVVPSFVGTVTKSFIIQVKEVTSPDPRPGQVVIRWALTPYELLTCVLRYPSLDILFTNEWQCLHAVASADRDLGVHQMWLLAGGPKADVILMAHSQDLEHAVNGRTNVWVANPMHTLEDSALCNATHYNCRCDPLLCSHVPPRTPVCYVDKLSHVSLGALAYAVTGRVVMSYHHRFPRARGVVCKGYQYERTGDGMVVVAVPESPCPSRTVSAMDWLQLGVVSANGLGLAWSTRFQTRFNTEIATFYPADPSVADAVVADIRARRLVWETPDYYGDLDQRFVATIAQMYDRSDFVEKDVDNSWWLSACKSLLPRFGIRLQEPPPIPIRPKTTAQVWSAGKKLVADLVTGSGMKRRIVVSRRVVAIVALSLAGVERSKETFERALETAKRNLPKLNEEQQLRTALFAATVAFLDVDETQEVFETLKRNMPKLRGYNKSKDFTQGDVPWPTVVVGAGLATAYAIHLARTEDRPAPKIISAAATFAWPKILSNCSSWVAPVVTTAHEAAHVVQQATQVVTGLVEIGAYPDRVDVVGPRIDPILESWAGGLRHTVQWALRPLEWTRDSARGLGRAFSLHLGILARTVLGWSSRLCTLGVDNGRVGVLKLLERFQRMRMVHIPMQGKLIPMNEWLFRSAVLAPVMEETLKRILLTVHPTGALAFAIMEFLGKLPAIDTFSDLIWAAACIPLHQWWASLPWWKGVLWHSAWNILVTFLGAWDATARAPWWCWVICVALALGIAFGRPSTPAGAAAVVRPCPGMRRKRFCCQHGNPDILAIMNRPIYDGIWADDCNPVTIIPPDVIRCSSKPGSTAVGVVLRRYKPECVLKCTCNEGMAMMCRLCNPRPDPSVDTMRRFYQFISRHAATVLYGWRQWRSLERVPRDIYLRHLEPSKRRRFLEGEQVYKKAGRMLVEFLNKWIFPKGDELVCKGADRWDDMPPIEEGGGLFGPGFVLPTNLTPRAIGADTMGAWVSQAGPWMYTVEHTMIDKTRDIVNLGEADGVEAMAEEIRAGNLVWCTKGLNANEKGLFFDIVLKAFEYVYGKAAVIGMDGVKYDSASMMHIRGAMMAIFQRLGVGLEVIWGMLKTGWRVKCFSTTGWVAIIPGIMVSGEPGTSGLHVFFNGLSSIFVMRDVLDGVPPIPDEQREREALDKEACRSSLLGMITDLLGWRWFDWRRQDVVPLEVAETTVASSVIRSVGRWFSEPTLTPVFGENPRVDLATLTRLNGSTNPHVAAVAVVDGDDNMTFIPAGAVQANTGELVAQHFRGFGVPMEVNVFKDAELADYCSGFHYPCKVAGQLTRIHGPRIMRAFIKHGFCRHPYSAKNFRNWMKSVSLPARNDWHHIPILRVVAEVEYRLSEDAKVIKIVDESPYRAHVAHRGEVCEETWNFVERIYRVAREQLIQVENLLRTVDSIPCEVDHPVLDLLVLTDFPELV